MCQLHHMSVSRGGVPFQWSLYTILYAFRIPIQIRNPDAGYGPASASSEGLFLNMEPFLGHVTAYLTPYMFYHLYYPFILPVLQCVCLHFSAISWQAVHIQMDACTSYVYISSVCTSTAGTWVQLRKPSKTAQTYIALDRVLLLAVVCSVSVEGMESLSCSAQVPINNESLERSHDHRFNSYSGSSSSKFSAHLGSTVEPVCNGHCISRSPLQQPGV